MGSDPSSCPVCKADAGAPVYRSAREQSLTSLCQLRPGRVTVFACAGCGHLFGEPMEDVEAFYEADYKILIAEDEEDQIYEEKDGVITFRADHQMATLKDRIQLAPGARVLDFGCAKATMSKRLKTERPDIAIHLFDVSHLYVDFWDRFTAKDAQAIHETPADWDGHFDLVTTYFAFEHIPDPASAMRHIHRLLADGGQVYGIVPHVFDNIADFVVIDHVGHFTPASLSRLLADAGFGDISVETKAHRGALVFRATKQAVTGPVITPTDEMDRARDLATYWSGIDDAIRAREASHEGPAAIYGSGFYGAYILSALDAPDHIHGFLDKNPFLQGRDLFGKPILPPDHLPADIKAVWAGLNPAVAGRILDGSGWMAGRDLTILTLEGGTHA